MPDIRYVCLSDMHLGDVGSLLTNLRDGGIGPDPSAPSPCLKQMVECLRHLIAQNQPGEKPALILNGDILELALATTNQAAMAFERFVELIMPQGNELFERIIYIPGNHDHHLWETARETQYVDYMTRSLPAGKYLSVPWHATNMFERGDTKPVRSYFLTSLVQRYPHLKDTVIATAYPNFGLFEEERQKCVIFHHGHFIESIYELVTFVMSLVFADREQPRQVWDIEWENFAWIDFFWSMLGQSGDAGRQIGLIYDKTHDEEERKKLLHALAHNLARRSDLPGWGDLMEEQVLKRLFDAAADRLGHLERARTDAALSAEAEKGLSAYLSGPLREQLLIEMKGNIPPEITFVFGHTHKPFQQDSRYEGYPESLNVYNSGGWVVDTVDPQPLHGGAVVLVDEELNAVSLRMYNEKADKDEYAVRVEEALTSHGPNNPLYDRVSQLVDPLEDPWKTLSATVADSVSIRRENLRTTITETD